MNTRNNLICPNCQKKIDSFYLKYSRFKKHLFKIHRESNNKWYVSRRVISLRYNLAPTTIKKYDKLGIPNMGLGSNKVYNIEECDKWMKENKIQYFRIKNKINLELISEH